MEHYAMMSLALQKLAELEVSCCSESPQCSCSKCKMGAAFAGFSITDCHAQSELPKRSGQSPKIAYIPDGHRCKRFPCPICHPGRSRRDGLSSAVVTPQMLESYAHGAEQQLLRHGHHPAGVILFGDGGHTCRKFPCPVCNGRSAALAVEVGC